MTFLAGLHFVSACIHLLSYVFIYGWLLINQGRIPRIFKRDCIHKAGQKLAGVILVLCMAFRLG
jgi:hypothetical protein